MSEGSIVFFLGVAVGVLIGLIALGNIILPSHDAKWCARIEESQMPTTFAECLEDYEEVPKRVPTVQN